MPCTNMPFSIPCESWGSATQKFDLISDLGKKLFQYSLRIVGFRDPPIRGLLQKGTLSFQYSLRIVGFRDIPFARSGDVHCPAFSIPCESWGSATLGTSKVRIPTYDLSVFPANCGVPRHIASARRRRAEALSVFPANRGVPRRKCGMLCA